MLLTWPSGATPGPSVGPCRSPDREGTSLLASASSWRRPPSRLGSPQQTTVAPACNPRGRPHRARGISWEASTTCLRGSGTIYGARGISLEAGPTYQLGGWHSLPGWSIQFQPLLPPCGVIITLASPYRVIMLASTSPCFPPVG